MNMQTLTVAESTKFLEFIRNVHGTRSQSMKGLRNYTMALLMLDAGLRCGEVVELSVGDLVFNMVPVQSLIVRAILAKKGHQRTIPLSARTRSALFEMIEVWWINTYPENTGYAFYEIRDDKPITRRQVERIVKQASLSAIGRPVHPHLLRHTFGTRLMRLASSRVAQVLLGHKNLSSTQIYQHPDQDDLQLVIDGIATADNNKNSQKI